MTQSTAVATTPKSHGLAAISTVIQNYRRVLVALLLALIAIAATAQSALKPFWWDELASYDIALLPHASDVWSFFRDGLDTPSPVPTVLVHAVLHMGGTSEVQARLPFEIGFLLMCLCLYGIVARRYGASWGLAAMLMPAISGTFYFASELRAYGVLLGCISTALYCWQSANRSGLVRRLSIAGIFAGLTIAISFHIFTLFVLIPFALAQLLRDRREQRIDWPVWLALALSPISLIPQLPGMQAAHRIYSGPFWAKPHGGQILFSYSYAMGVGWTIAVIVVLLAWPALERKFLSLRSDNRDQHNDRGFDAAEWTMLATLVLIPWFAWPLSHLLGVYVPRYTIALTIGFVLLIVAGTAEALRRNRIAGSMLAFTFLLVFFHDKLPEVRSAWHSRGSRNVALARQPWIKALEANPLPIVAPNTDDYTVLQYYFPPELEQKLYYTLDTPAAIRSSEDLDAGLSMRLFSTRLPMLRVRDYTTFARAHKSFLVIVRGSLDQGGQTGDFNIHWFASCSEPMQLGFRGYTLYQVDVTGNP